MKKGPTKLKKYGNWHWLWRGLFELQTKDGLYHIDVDYFDFDERIHVYKDGELVDTKKSPAKVMLEDKASIEAGLSTYGMKYVRLRGADGKTSNFAPSKGTPEAWRKNFNQNHPRSSKVLNVFSWTVLIIAAITQLPELINILSQWFNTKLPTFELPFWANITLSVAGVIAALDRALQLKHNKWID